MTRIGFHFDRRQFGALRRLIDRLNEEAATPAVVHPPAPFTDQQADREW
jgi:hypothetical protein